MNQTKNARWKRWMAGMLTMLLALQSPAQTVVAWAWQEAGNDASVMTPDLSDLQVSENNISSASEGQDAAQDGCDVPESSGESMEPGKAKADPADGNDEKSEPEVLADLALDYVYIENAAIKNSETEHLLVSVSGETQNLTGANLTLSNTESGEEIVLPADSLEDGALAFSVKGSDCPLGVYRLTALSVFADDKVGSITFADVPGMEDVCFAVDTDSPYAADAFTQEAADEEELETLFAAEQSGQPAVMTAEGGQDGVSTAESSDATWQIESSVVNLSGEEDLSGTAIEEALKKAQEDVSNGNSVDLDADTAASGEEIPALRTVAGSVVVVLDPGHDSTHVGARANGLNEEELTLKIAKYCKEYLESTYTNVVVYMTRSTASCPYPGTSSGDDNAARVAAAARMGADAYVSIHLNTTGTSTTTATGAIVFYPNSNYKNSVGSSGSVIASKIIEQLEKAGLHNNGIRIRNSENNTTYPDGSLADYYGVIRLSKEQGIPAVIVEHAFLNNPSDAAFLKSEDNLKKLGIADALGIANAYNLSTEEVQYDADDLSVSDVDGANGSFKITLSGASPVDRIAKVQFKVYPTEDSSLYYMYEATNEGKGVYTAQANVSKHGGKTGKYKIIAYAYDAAGKKNQLRSATVTIEKTQVNTDAMKLSYKISKTQKTVFVTLKGNEGAASVYFKVYSKENGKDDIKKYNATKQKDGSWKATVTIANHKSSGAYVVLAYSKDYYGKTQQVKTGGFTIDGPTAQKVVMKKLNLSKGTFQLRIYGAWSSAGVKKVSVTVRNLDGKKIKKTYTPKKSKSGYYYFTVDMKDYKYQFGRYQTVVSVTDGNKITKTVLKTTHEIKEPQVAVTAKLKSKQTKLVMKADNLGIAANVKGVRFLVYPVSDSSNKKKYDAKKASDGSYSKTISISDFGESGAYKVQAYVKNASGKYVKIGEKLTVTVSDITGGKVTVKEKSENASYIYLSSVSCNTSIEKVEVKAWPDGMKSAAYTYKASLRSNGSYRALIDSKKHNGVGGVYRYQITVTGKNGIKRVLVKGKLTLGESEADDGGMYAISGSSSVTVAQLVAYYKKNATYPSYYAGSDAPTLTKFCKIYYDECQKEGIRVEVAFAQAMKETGFLRYGGDVDISQYNFAGLGATGGGAKGLSFSTVRLGIRAQVQHLKAYANTKPLAQTCVDPRFQYVTRGCAPYVEWLGIPDNPNGKGWATAQNYGSSILKMIRDIKKC